METYYTRLLREGVPDKLPPGPIDFQALFDEYVASTPKVWGHDRNESVGASEAFGCIRRNWFLKRGHLFGYEPDPSYKERWGATRRGDLIENHHVVPAITEGILRRGGELLLAGEGQDTIIDGRSSATLDGLVTKVPKDALSLYGVDDIESDCFVLEMKSFDPMISLSEEKGIHRGQAQMQLGLIRETTDFKPVYAIILYVQASFIDDIRPFVIKYDEEIYEIGRNRNDTVFEEKDPAKLQPEGKFIGLCDYCAFTIACARVNKERVPEKTEPLKKKEIEAQEKELLDALNNKVYEADKLKKEIKERTIALEALNEDIKQELILRNKSRAVGEGWKVSYTMVPGRSVLSKEKMVEAGLDPDDFIEQGKGFEKLTLTLS